MTSRVSTVAAYHCMIVNVNVEGSQLKWTLRLQLHIWSLFYPSGRKILQASAFRRTLLVSYIGITVVIEVPNNRYDGFTRVGYTTWFLIQQKDFFFGDSWESWTQKFHAQGSGALIKVRSFELTHTHHHPPCMKAWAARPRLVCPMTNEV